MNLADTELCELAAKALGIAVKRDAQNASEYELHVVKHDEARKALGLSFSYFHPLTNSGLALRLATALGLSVEQWTRQDIPDVTVTYRVGGRQHNVVVQHGDDPHEATRRAIITAAARIGAYEE